MGRNTTMATILEECLASQKKAGFKQEDRRSVPCPMCTSPGYNTGWGWWAFECGGEVLSDGTVDVKCPLVEA
jgi:hypothetical protein